MIKKRTLFLVWVILILAVVSLSGQVVNLSKSPNKPSNHPSVLAYGDKVMVVWREQENSTIMYTYYTVYSNGTWSPPASVFNISLDPQAQKNPHIALGPDGVIHMTWGHGNGSTTREIYHATYRNSVWTDIRNIEQIYLSQNKNSNWPRVGVFDNNTVNITWTSEVRDSYDQVIRNNWKLSGGSWNPNGRIVSKKKANESTGHSDIYTRWNTAYCVWREGVTPGGWNIKFAQKSQTGEWTNPLIVNDTSGTHSYARVAVDSRGNVHVLWENFRNIRYRARINNVWQPSVSINYTDSKHPNFQDIDVDRGDNLHACYVAYPNYPSDLPRQIYYNFKPSGGNWVTADEIQLSNSNTDNQLPAISVDNAGNAHVVWASNGEHVNGDIMYYKVPGNLGTINVTSPAAGGVYLPGDRVTISWTSEGITGLVNVFARWLDGMRDYLVANGIPYNSSPIYKTVPTNTKLKRGYYVIRVIQDAIIGESGTFSIPGITITSNNGGSTYGVCGQIPLSWTTKGITGNLTILLRRADGSADYPVATVPYSNTPYTCNVPPEATPGTYYIKVSQDRVSAVTGNFAIVDSQLTLTYPTGGEVVRSGTIQTLTWTSNPSGFIANVKIGFSPNNGVDWITLVESTPNTGSYTGVIPPDSNTYDQCVIKISDAVDGCPSDVSGLFTVLPALPINVILPVGGETYSTGSVITIAWTTCGITGNVAFGLIKTDGSTGYLIEKNYPYDGVPYYYTIPAHVEPGTYFIRVKQDTNRSDSGNFTINN